VPQGVERAQIVANTDWAPTIADWAQVRTPDFVDGRSFSPLLSSDPPPWRKRLLIEHSRSSHAFRGIRTSDGRTYVTYEAGQRELYDLHADPYQLRNVYRASPRAAISKLEDQLRALKSCARSGCSRAEGF
jgi:arylsulfatase A-like enzyme